MSDRPGYRGYIGSRPLRGTSFPQRVQNLVIRDYAAARGMRYLLSATEYAMRGCYMILEDVLTELPTLEGVIVFSAFLLPLRRERRAAIYDRVLAAGASLHAALEQLTIRDPRDISRFEDVIAVAHALPTAPLRGHFDKSPSAAADPLVSVLLRSPGASP